MKCKNSDIFDTCIQPMIKYAFEGYNCAILAYGQTSSGKTHTIQGEENDSGMIFKTIHEIYRIAEKLDPSKRLEIECNYFEIYNEQVNDLLKK